MYRQFCEGIIFIIKSVYMCKACVQVLCVCIFKTVMNIKLLEPVFEKSAEFVERIMLWKVQLGSNSRCMFNNMFIINKWSELSL
jgi:hypothetical protein